jgi:uncharacterized membrane protein
MNTFLRFVRDRVLAGLFFILPFLALVLIGREILRFVAKLLHPIANRLPTAGFTGPAADYVIAALVLLIVAFLLGLVSSTGPVKGFSQKVEHLALLRIPGYTLIRGFFRGPDERDGMKVLFVTLDDAWLFGFLIEELPDGMLAVFIPGVPSPISGSLYFFTERQVRRTDISVRDAMRVLARLGVGSSKLVTGRLPTDG